MDFLQIASCPISIHTTLAGGDGLVVSCGCYHAISIHTTLAGGDQSKRPMGGKPSEISIHTTLAGGDAYRLRHTDHVEISIHTTLAGGDKIDITPICDKCDFNPHHPRGWRHFALYSFQQPWHFNPHHPRGWRQGHSNLSSLSPLISIHTTLAGGDQPGRGTAPAPAQISIHTTLAGGDPHAVSMQRVPGDGFQSTPPSRVATPLGAIPAHLIVFQSTPPSRVATGLGGFYGCPARDFNPHHPRGWRLWIRPRGALTFGFQSTPPSRVATFLFYVSFPRSRFQSTPPSRVATGLIAGCGFILKISIHTTLAGGDVIVLLISNS